MMHQPVIAPDTDRRPVPTVSLRTGDRWVAVPAWWAAEHFYRHGQTVRPEDEGEARAAVAIAKLTPRRIERIRTRPMDPHIPQEARVRPPVLDACPPSARVNTRRLRAVLLLASACISAGAVIILIRSFS